MQIQINKSTEIRNDLLIIIDRSEIETALLSIVHRGALMLQPGLTRHHSTSDAERAANKACKVPFEEHLKALGLLSTDENPVRPVIAIGNRNLGNNHGFIAWQRDQTPTLFHVMEDPLEYSDYSCLVVDREDKLSIRSLSFSPSTGSLGATDSDGKLTEDIEWATFGQQVLRAGKVAPIEEIIDRFYDIRHVLAFDQNSPEGKKIGEGIYNDYPARFYENAMAAWREKGVPRSRYLHNAVGLSSDCIFLLQREGTIEEIACWLREAGAEDGLILDNGGSVACWAWWVSLNGGFLFTAPDFRPPSSSIVAFVLKGPVRINIPGGSVSGTVV